MAVTVIIGACQGCGACVLTCPQRAIRPAAGAPVVVTARCDGCGECEEICPVDAITIQSPPPGRAGQPGAARPPGTGHVVAAVGQR